MDQLAQVDPTGRPLYAILTGETLKGGGYPARWSQSELLSDWLRRERERHWIPHGVDLPHANLAVVATVLGGTTFEHLEDFPADLELPDPTSFRSHRYKAITGHEIKSDKPQNLPPVEPDVLGAFFVLEHLRDPLGIGAGTRSVATQRAAALRDRAWHLDGPATALFIERAQDEFIDHPMLLELLRRPKNLHPHYKEWGILQVAVTITCSISSPPHINLAEERVTELAEVAEEHAEQTELRRQHAHAKANLISCYASSKEFTLGHKHVCELAELVKTYPEESKLVSAQARALVNFITVLGEAGYLEYCGTYLKELSQLGEEHPKNQNLRFLQAMATQNVMNYTGKAGDFDSAAERLQQLAELAANHPKESVLRTTQADATYGFIKITTNAGDYHSAIKAIGQLGELAHDHPNQPELRDICAQATFHLICGLIEGSHFKPADMFLKALDKLITDYPEEPNLMRARAAATYHLIIGLFTLEDFDSGANHLRNVSTSYRQLINN